MSDDSSGGSRFRILVVDALGKHEQSILGLRRDATLTDSQVAAHDVILKKIERRAFLLGLFGGLIPGLGVALVTALLGHH